MHRHLSWVKMEVLLARKAQLLHARCDINREGNQDQC
jgi:hypothetical protein